MILAVLQARMSSTRLPGKVLKLILGEPMIFREIERVKRSVEIDELVLATSTDIRDNVLASACADRSIACFRGALDDVLDRVYRAAEPYRPDHVVRLTGDCPLIDSEIIDSVIRLAVDGNFDFATNGKPYSFPDGLDVEVVRFGALEEAWKEAALPSHREHVLTFIHRQPERFYLGFMRSLTDYSNHRWTVDEPEDFAFVTRIYKALYPSNNAFTMQDILKYLNAHPELMQINAQHKRNDGRRSALIEDIKMLEQQTST